MTTYERATFALDELGQWEGVHIPSVRWNGWACPFFTIDTCRQIAEVVNPLEGNCEVISVGESQVFSIYSDSDGEDIEEVEPELVDGVPMYPLGAFGWVWEVVTPTHCVMCGKVTGSTYEFCEVCDEIDPNPHAHLHDLPYVEPCEECGADMEWVEESQRWSHAVTADSHKCYTAYRWGVK